MTMIAIAISDCAIRYAGTWPDPPTAPDRLLLETGFYVLMENGSYIELE